MGPASSRDPAESAGEAHDEAVDEDDHDPRQLKDALYGRAALLNALRRDTVSYCSAVHAQPAAHPSAPSIQP